MCCDILKCMFFFLFLFFIFGREGRPRVYRKGQIGPKAKESKRREKRVCKMESFKLDLPYDCGWRAQKSKQYLE